MLGLPNGALEIRKSLIGAMPIDQRFRPFSNVNVGWPAEQDEVGVPLDHFLALAVDLRERVRVPKCT